MAQCSVGRIIHVVNKFSVVMEPEGMMSYPKLSLIIRLLFNRFVICIKYAQSLRIIDSRSCLTTECHGRLISTSASYSGDP
jgi:hypothetical protein